MERLPCPSCGTEARSGDRFCRSCGVALEAEKNGSERNLEAAQHARLSDDMEASESEIPIREAMKKDLRAWGIGMIIIGAVSIVLSGLLDPVWGVLLIIAGVLSLSILHRGMYIALGVVLFLAAAGNIFFGGLGLWTLFGALQVFWGVQQIRKFSKYKGSPGSLEGPLTETPSEPDELSLQLVLERISPSGMLTAMDRLGLSVPEQPSSYVRALLVRADQFEDQGEDSAMKVLDEFDDEVGWKKWTPKSE